MVGPPTVGGLLIYRRYILTTDQSDTGSARIFSRRTNQTGSTGILSRRTNQTGHSVEGPEGHPRGGLPLRVTHFGSLPVTSDPSGPLTGRPGRTPLGRSPPPAG
eukprot:1188167-Prorocentrum_minimum.AAC.8